LGIPADFSSGSSTPRVSTSFAQSSPVKEPTKDTVELRRIKARKGKGNSFLVEIGHCSHGSDGMGRWLGPHPPTTLESHTLIGCGFFTFTVRTMRRREKEEDKIKVTFHQTLKLEIRRRMTTNAQMKNIKAYVEAFLTEHGDENLLELWKGDNIQQAFDKVTNDKKSSGKKDPNKPKRGKSAYLFFCADHREKAKEELGAAAKPTEVTKELGKRWNELKASTKASDKKKLEKYEEQAREDKERYEGEIVDYTPPPSDEEDAGKKKSSGNKDSNKPKRGKSSYIFFCADHREKVREKVGDAAKASDVTAELGKRWKELKASTKAADKKKLEKYEEQAREDKERYEREMAAYTPTPSDENENEEETRKMVVANEKLNIPEGITHGTPGTNKMQIIAPIPYPEPPTDGKPINYPEPPTEKKSSKKKVTGYVLFCMEERPQVIEQYPDAKGAEVTKFLADLWKAMDNEEKNQWNIKATK